MATCLYQRAVRNRDIKIDNKSLEGGTRLTDRNSRMKSRKCLPSFSAIVFSSLLSKNKKIKTRRIVILLVGMCGCETWSLTLREERRLRVLENKALRKIF